MVTRTEIYAFQELEKQFENEELVAAALLSMHFGHLNVREDVS